MAKQKLSAREVAKREKERKKHKSEYTIAHTKNTYKRFEIRVRMDNEQDMIEHLESIESVNAYIKELIRKDMENNV